MEQRAWYMVSLCGQIKVYQVYQVYPIQVGPKIVLHIKNQYLGIWLPNPIFNMPMRFSWCLVGLTGNTIYKKEGKITLSKIGLCLLSKQNIPTKIPTQKYIHV